MTVASLRPLAEWDLAAARRVRGVFTDIDDTLTRDGAIEPSARAALDRLAAAGLAAIAITGRPAGWSEPCALHWPVAAVVAENGGVMLQRVGERLHHHFAQDETTRRDHRARLDACAADVLKRVPGTRLAEDSPGRLTDIAIDHAEHAHLDAAQIDAVVAVMREHGLTATVSSIHVNGWLGAHDKWSGAQWSARHCTGRALDPAEWLFVGDSSNDAPMFARIPLSVGVANIARFLPALATPPAYLATRERGDGFAEVIDALLAARR